MEVEKVTLEVREKQLSIIKSNIGEKRFVSEALHPNTYFMQQQQHQQQKKENLINQSVPIKLEFSIDIHQPATERNTNLDDDLRF